MLVILIGFLSGIISGMGIGGGTILIPALVFLLGVRQQVAQSVNLIGFIPTAIVAILVHLKKKNIELKLLFKLTALGLLGAVIGALLAVNLNSELLKKTFGIFLFVMGIYEITSKKGSRGKLAKNKQDR